MGKIEKYKLNLGDKTLYLTHISEIDTGRKDFEYKKIWGNHYIIEDDIPRGSLPCTTAFASDFTNLDDRGGIGHYQNYNDPCQWLIETIKKFGEKI